MDTGICTGTSTGIGANAGLVLCRGTSGIHAATTADSMLQLQKKMGDLFLACNQVRCGVESRNTAATRDVGCTLRQGVPHCSVTLTCDVLCFAKQTGWMTMPRLAIYFPSQFGCMLPYMIADVYRQCKNKASSLLQVRCKPRFKEYLSELSMYCHMCCSDL